MDGAVGRSRANHVPGAISDSRTTRTSTPAKSAPSPSPEFGSGALVEVDRPRGNSTTAQAMANSVNILLGVGGAAAVVRLPPERHPGGIDVGI